MPHARFEEFFDSQIPKYAILSHRWEGKEVSFPDFEDSKQKGSASFTKISQCCTLAAGRGHDWVWIDTCCINKRSSAELSEAINSMYRWYAEAKECYAYLSDVTWVADSQEALLSSRAAFRKSAWFTRGWTLQELLAPPDVIFFDRRWEMIGPKSSLKETRHLFSIGYGLQRVSDEEGSLSADVSAATGIEAVYLINTLSAPIACVATKMSWASKRNTSRREDMAYCLLGIFNVNMPLLYGEGRKAFLRLQLEIINQSDDNSIFAWKHKYECLSGLLAPSPEYFVDSAKIYISRPLFERYERLPYRMTHKGLEIHLPSNEVRTSGTSARLSLKCSTYDENTLNAIAISLLKIGSTWHRMCTEWEVLTLTEASTEASPTKAIYVPQDNDAFLNPSSGS